MPTSVVTFTDFNIDPLPDPTLFGFTSLSYGSVVGGGSALDAKDTTSSYIGIGDSSGAGTAVTCRPVCTPPIPASALFPVDIPTREADFAAFLMQVAFVTAPTMPVRGGPDVALSPDFTFSTPDGHTAAAGVADGRFSDQTPWGINWWDETDCASDGGPAVFTIDQAIVGPGFVADAARLGGYLLLWTHVTPLVISQVVGRITWVPGVELRTTPDPEQFRTVSGTPFNLLIPGAGWTPWRDHGASG